MNKDKIEKISKLCSDLHTALESTNNNLDELRKEISSLDPEDQDPELILAFNRILDYLGYVSESREFPYVSMITKDGPTKEYVK